MKQIDIIKTLISIIIIIVLVIFIVNINKVVAPKMPRTTEEQTMPILNESKPDIVVTGGVVTEEFFGFVY